MRMPAAWLLLVLLLMTPVYAHAQEPAAAPTDVAAVRANAEKGDALAQLALGLLYKQGDGIEQDDAQAGIWFRKAAEQNNGQAQLQLGQSLTEGVGSWQMDAAGKVVWNAPANVNYSEAYFWLSLADNNKIADAAAARDDAALHLTPAQIVASNQRVKHWSEKLASLSFTPSIIR